jgi:hypothetical protein
MAKPADPGLYDNPEIEGRAVECSECWGLYEADATYVCVHCGENVCEWCAEVHQERHEAAQNERVE